MRRSHLAVVLVVVALVLAACGTEDDGSGQAQRGERPKLPATAAANAGATRDSAAAATEATEATEAMLYPARHVEYRLAPGATAPATEATAYRLVPGEVDRDRVREIARAFGMKGDVDGTGGPGQGMTVSDGDTHLVVDAGSTVSWSYSRNPERGVSSDVAVACAPDTKCPEPPPPTPPPGLPTAAEAEEKARRLLDGAGVDAGRLMETGAESETVTRTASFAPEVDGIEVIGLSASVTFGEHGRVEYANGWLGRFEEVGEYDLVGMAEAVERLKTGFGTPTDRVATMEAQREQTGAGSSGSSPGSAPTEPVPVPDQPPETVTTLPPEIVEITGGRLVLNVAYPNCPGDPVYVVPAFAFEPERAGSAVAVTEGDLVPGTQARDLQAEPCPGVKPEPEPMPMPMPEPAPLPPDAGATEPARPIPTPQTTPARP